MAEKFRSLLPPSAVKPERAQEQSTTDNILTLDTNMIRRARNHDECPAHLLPWLAWERAVDFWQDDWTEDQKRQVLRDAPYVHRHRGTPGAVLRALSVLGYPAVLVEWWQENPRGTPYTFRVQMTVNDAVPADFYGRVRELVIKSKNLRSSLSSIDITTSIGDDSVFCIGGAITGHIDVVIEAGG